jgi:hypothetical protein
MTFSSLRTPADDKETIYGQLVRYERRNPAWFPPDDTWQRFPNLGIQQHTPNDEKPVSSGGIITGEDPSSSARDQFAQRDAAKLGST